MQLSKNKIFGSFVEEVQYRESSRGLVSHGLFVAREVVAENKRQRRSSKRSKGNHICNYLKIKFLAPLLKKFSIVNHQGVLSAMASLLCAKLLLKTKGREEAVKVATKGNHICNYLKIKSLLPLLKKYSIVNHQGF